MSHVEPVQSTTIPAANIEAVKSSPVTADYDAFLQLLVSQLKNQDPTDPTNPTEFIAQLASFSGVEQQVQTNAKLDALIQSNLLGGASELIGNSVTSSSGDISGIVASVTLSDTGLVATLENGATLPITTGVVIYKS